MKALKPKVEVRWIDDDDPQEIVRIAAENFGPEHRLSLQDVYTFINKTDHIPKVLHVNGKVVGYLFYLLKKDTVVVQEIAVYPHRKGYGRRLMRHLIVSLNRLRRRNILVGVPEVNLAAQLFFRSLGFKCFRIVKRKDR
jgi:ribosomal-protein-alanine N-acetyltransferase